MAGIDPAIISRLESGDRDSVRFETLCRISVALGVSLDDLAAALGLISGDSDVTFAGADRVRLSDQVSAVQRFLLKAQQVLMKSFRPLLRRNDEEVDGTR